jgi:hypothetical protein
MEVQIAGSVEERNLMMPLLYIDSHRQKSEIEVRLLIELNILVESNEKCAERVS